MSSKGIELGAGTSARILDWEPGTVLKQYRTHIKSRVIENELQAMIRAEAGGVAVPHVHEKCEFEGKPSVSMTRIVGPSVLALILSNPWRTPRVLAEMAALQFQFHQLSGEGLPQQKDDLAKLCQRAELPSRLDSLLRKRLSELPVGTALCHGDYHPGNALVAADQMWVVDWGKARCGHPAADVAQSLIQIEYGNTPPRIPLKIQSPIRYVLAATYQKAYLHHQKESQEADYVIRHEDIKAWQPVSIAAKLPFVSAVLRDRMIKRLEGML